MEILTKKKINFKKNFAYLGAFLITVIVLFQISIGRENGFKIFLGDIIITFFSYFTWAYLIEYINGVLPSMPLKQYGFLAVIKVILSVLILVFINLIVSNLLYYLYISLTTKQNILEALSSFRPYIILSIFNRILNIVIIIILLKVFDAYFFVRQQKVKVISLENQLHLSQLETLRNQLDPHFLFNSLNTLNILIGYNDKKAKSMLIKITSLLRKILDKREKQLITFEEELEYFTNYLEIEEERFHDRLQVNISLDDKIKNFLVPTLILQPLIENAFKHGISLIEEKGEINLSAKMEGQYFIINLINTIPKNNSIVKSSTKVGLTNLQSRLKQVYGEGFEFKTTKKDNRFTASVKINKIQHL